jgi:hypothetical protein
MSLKPNDKMILELCSWNCPNWTRVEGEIVECLGEKYFKHRNENFAGAAPTNAVVGYCYWTLAPECEGIEWRFPKLLRQP